jgi:hypothetical protein
LPALQKLRTEAESRPPCAGFNPRTNPPTRILKDRVRDVSRVHALVASRSLPICRLTGTNAFSRSDSAIKRQIYSPDSREFRPGGPHVRNPGACRVERQTFSITR